MSDYVTLVGTVVFQRPSSCAIRFDGARYDDPNKQFQFVPKSRISGVDFVDTNLVDIDIRVQRYYYQQHIKWRLGF